jgi:hypothetical protein
MLHEQENSQILFFFGRPLRFCLVHKERNGWHILKTNDRFIPHQRSNKRGRKQSHQKMSVFMHPLVSLSCLQTSFAWEQESFDLKLFFLSEEMTP